MTDTVPAAATGLPAASFDRRSFLATLAAAGVMTPGCKDGDEMSAVPEDHPDAALLELGAVMEAQREEQRRLGAVTDAAYDALPALPAWPAVCRTKNGDACQWPIERASTALNGNGGVDHRYWSNAKMFRDYLACTAKLGEPLAYFRGRAAEIADAIEDHGNLIARMETAVGIPAACAAEKAASAALDATVVRIADTTAKTMAGLLVKAKAAAYDLCDLQDDATAYLEQARADLATAIRERRENINRRPLQASIYLDVLTLSLSLTVAA